MSHGTYGVRICREFLISGCLVTDWSTRARRITIELFKLQSSLAFNEAI